MPPRNVTEQEDGIDVGPVRIMNLNARRFTITEEPIPGQEYFNNDPSRPITWLVSFDVKKPAGETRKVPFKVKVKQREAGKTYVIKTGTNPAILLNEDDVFEGDPAVGITT
jgi:hypothetical protein